MTSESLPSMLSINSLYSTELCCQHSGHAHAEFIPDMPTCGLDLVAGPQTL